MIKTLKFRTNLNCGSCIASVTPFLDREPSITHWEVDTSVPEKTLTVQGADISPEKVAATVAKAGFKVLGPLSREADDVKPEIASSASAVPVSYYPLALLLAFLLGIVGLVEFTAGSFDWERAMRHFMSAFFLAFAFFKLLDLRGFADSYRMYDVVAERVPVYGYLYPFIELGLGIAYLLNFQPTATNIVTLAVMSVSTVGVVRSLLKKQTIRCACLGTVFNLPMSTVTLVEDAGMIAMAGAMLLMSAG